MVCSKCGYEPVVVDQPCPECGFVGTETDEVNSMIHDILEDDTYTPKFEEVTEVPEGAKAIESVFGTDKKDEKSKKNGSLLKSLNGKKKAGNGAAKNGAAKNGTAKNGTKPAGGSKPKKGNGAAAKPKVTKGSQVTNWLRYFLAGIIVLFTISLFFNWLTLSGNAVNYGVIRDEVTSEYMNKGIEGKSIEALEAYDDAILVFSGWDLYTFGKEGAEGYKEITGAKDVPTTSLSAYMQRYYMMAMALVLIINLLCLALVLVFKSLKPMAWVRNLAGLNFVIIGLNYLCLRVPHLSMFAIHAKDVIAGTNEIIRPSMKLDGIAMDETYYPYLLEELRGFWFALILLGIWLLTAIILAEVKNRRDEIAIENTEI